MQQEKRYHRGLHEDLYLLDKVLDNHVMIFKISGSTANVYDIVIKNRSITCNCPDMSDLAKHHGCVCKHCCFVLFKVLKSFSVNDSNFFDTLVFNNLEIIKICTSFDNLNLNNNNFTDKNLTNKYKNVASPNKFNTNNYNKDDDCIICFNEFGNSNVLACPTCHNVLHEKCIKKWLNMGKHSCVYCRSNVWQNLSNKYINLS